MSAISSLTPPVLQPSGAFFYGILRGSSESKTMPLVSKFFRTSTERQVEKLWEDAEEATEREYGPIGRLGMAIIQASTNCRDAVKSLIEAPNETERITIERHVFFEFVYFFMHMSMRYCGQLTEERMNKVQEFLGPLISSVAVDSYCLHWPQEMRDKMIGQFYERLNGAELQYTECAEKHPKGDLQGKLRSLFMEIGSNISGICSSDDYDFGIIMPVSTAAVDEWKKMKLPDLVQAIKEST